MSSQPPRATVRGPRDREVLLLGIVVAVAALLWVGWITAPLFVFTETRPFSLTPHPIDLVRLFLAPVPTHGEGRLLGIASFDLTGGICGVGAACTNGATAVVTSLAAVVVFLHTTQLARSAHLAAAVALLWIISGPVLVTSFWQSARFDILATIAILVTTAWWWRWLGRARVTPVGALGFWVVSCLLMAIAFNVKEVGYLLVPVLPFLAVLRGMRIGAVRGNLILAPRRSPRCWPSLR